ncbi:SMP-30/gluconolactonase/LRE family protein [Roseateles violae]|uniref:SMP-30/gluconolactonase/LRE family protein n=1 Tax=Roseateles violae TaxID=3058042 RepID=A0ABT8DWM5_9BURK|nr:SMP-30/gluconolactonase/LRE family protein [Pelomonas sp. PFR6]MDN3921465.1 SMP-30/gluconolactonase/LRE family protein [Pelomonas sp. PFR6]
MILNERHEVVERQLLESGHGHPLQVYRVHNQVGEGPVWDAARACLWWIDVRAPELLRLDPASCALSRWRLPEAVGALALAADGRLLLALRTQAWLFDPATGKLEILAEVERDRPLNRLNEGKVSPSGRWWLVGSMDDSAGSKQAWGSLYRIDAAGQALRLHSGLTIANGIAWNADGSRLFFSDSWRGQVWSASWYESEGRMGPPTLFASSPEDSGRPDGAVVDAQGHYISAGVSAGCLNRFDAMGRCVEKTALPCRAPTMPCFGGATGQDLFVTSLLRPQWSQAPGGLDGQLFCLPGFGNGKPAALMKLQASDIQSI